MANPACTWSDITSFTKNQALIFPPRVTLYFLNIQCNAKEEKKTKNAKRVKRHAEMSAVHKRAREVQKESKIIQRRAKVEKATKRGYEDSGPLIIRGRAQEISMMSFSVP